MPSQAKPYLLFRFLINRKEAWRTDGGTAIFGAGAISLSLFTMGLNLYQVSLFSNLAPTTHLSLRLQKFLQSGSHLFSGPSSSGNPSSAGGGMSAPTHQNLLPLADLAKGTRENESGIKNRQKKKRRRTHVCPEYELDWD